MYKISFSTMAPDTKIPVGDPIWPRFNASFENAELDQVDILDKIYLGHPFTTWHKNRWRNAANYQCGQHIGVDFDTEDERSTIPHLMKDPFIRKFGFLLYTTPSHRPEAPRARAVFLLDQPIHQAKNYTNAVSSLLWLFGTADRQCKDSCRFFYGSRNCELEWLGQELPLEKVKLMIRQYLDTGEMVKRTHTKSSYTPTTDQAEVASALRAIPPWGIDYDDWLRVLMAIHQAWGDGGLPLAAQWAQGYDGEVEKKFRSFKMAGNVTGQVTLNTVFAMALDRGWKGGAV